MVRTLWLVAAFVAAIVIALAPAGRVPAQGSGASRNASLALGNPSNATTDPANKTNYLLKRTANDKYPGTTFSPELYSMSYNSDTGCPNWVAWHLSSAWLGAAPRQNDFRGDPFLPTGFTKVAGTWYDSTGFDQGHMCPSEDRSTTNAENSATFYMDNMVPQAPNLNRKCWAQLEQYCRDLANQGNEMYIVAGPWGTGGTGSMGFDDAIPNSGTNADKVKVPSHCWKVILVLPNGTNDLARIDNNTRTIGVWIPNDQTAANTTNWAQFRVSVDFIEQQTGYNFHRSVNDAIEAVIESRVDNVPIP
jgi:endonuclease G